MRFTETPIAGVMIVELEPVEDERGFFARSWDGEVFAARGLDSHIAQCNISRNRRRGTIRGMHFQAAPFGEHKLVRCTRGAIFDVALDLRLESPTFCRWFSAELDEDNHRMMWIPDGVAHGFQSLTDDSEVFYQMSAPYRADAARGVRWDDSAFAIAWPIAEAIVSERDRGFANFSGAKR